MGSLHTLSNLSPDTKYSEISSSMQQIKEENKIPTYDNPVSVSLRDIKLPMEFLDSLDNKSNLTDPRLMLAFKKKTALEEKERVKRYNKSFRLVSQEINSYLSEPDEKLKNTKES